MNARHWTAGNDVTRCTRRHEAHEPIEEAYWLFVAYIMGVASCGLAVLASVWWQ